MEGSRPVFSLTQGCLQALLPSSVSLPSGSSPLRPPHVTSVTILEIKNENSERVDAKSSKKEFYFKIQICKIHFHSIQC